MRHLASKCAIDAAKIPLTLEKYGNTGGPSVPLTITQGRLNRPRERALTLLMLAYGVGLSWASALLDLPITARLNHLVMDPVGAPKR